jgi:hypothetical protein
MTIWNILRPFDIIYSLLVQFVAIWYIFRFWYFWTKNNLATLVQTRGSSGDQTSRPSAKSMFISKPCSFPAKNITQTNKHRKVGAAEKKYFSADGSGSLGSLPTISRNVDFLSLGLNLTFFRKKIRRHERNELSK